MLRPTPALPVALLAEGVDRNYDSHHKNRTQYVALLAEGVDRNIEAIVKKSVAEVALLAEGVDRNHNHREAQALRRSRPPRGGRG